jgi:hypothetical protein
MSQTQSPSRVTNIVSHLRSHLDRAIEGRAAVEGALELFFRVTRNGGGRHVMPSESYLGGDWMVPQAERNRMPISASHGYTPRSGLTETLDIMGAFLIEKNSN